MNVKHFTHLFVFCLLFALFGIQTLYAQKLDQSIQSLENDFKSFKYEQVLKKGRFLLGDPYASRKDSLQIFQYMLSSAYALNDTSQARTIIEEILKIDHSFKLNPKDTSPKIIEFFNYVKQQNRREQEKNSTPIVRTITVPVKTSHLITSLLFPGAGHLLAGKKKKGYTYSAVTGFWLAGIVYSCYETDKRADDYLKAQRGADFSSLYDRYNTAYQIRNLLIVGYGLWNIFNLYDLNQTEATQLNVTSDADKTMLGVRIFF